MNIKKIVLFGPKSSKDGTFRGAPLALLRISSILDNEGYNIEIFTAVDKEDYKDKILESLDGAICLGINSMTGYQIQNALEVAKIAKKKYPDIPIIWGGYHPSVLPVQTVESQFVDIVVKGQGERTFAELVHKLEDNLNSNKPISSGLGNILGIVYKENGKIIENSDRPFEDINNFPATPYHLIDIEKHLSNIEVGSRTIEYTSSQGCPHQCRFCAEIVVYKRKWKGLKAERVVSEIESLVKNYKINGIIFVDSNFFVDKERVRKICKGIIDRKLNIGWGQANGRIEQLVRFDVELWELIRDSGCRSILIGAESGSQSILDLVDKKTKVEDTIMLTEICKRYKMRIIFSFMVGFPPKTDFEPTISIEKDFNETIKFIDKLFSISHENVFYVHVYTPYPGTPLFQASIENGMKEPKCLEEWSKFGLHDINTPWVPNKYSKKLKFLHDYIFNFLYKKQYKKRYKRFKIFFVVANNMLYLSASLRWKYKFFSFPVEWVLFKLFIKIRDTRSNKP